MKFPLVDFVTNVMTFANRCYAQAPTPSGTSTRLLRAPDSKEYYHYLGQVISVAVLLPGGGSDCPFLGFGIGNSSHRSLGLQSKCGQVEGVRRNIRLINM